MDGFLKGNLKHFNIEKLHISPLNKKKKKHHLVS